MNSLRHYQDTLFFLLVVTLFVVTAFSQVDFRLTPSYPLPVEKSPEGLPGSSLPQDGGPSQLIL